MEGEQKIERHFNLGRLYLGLLLVFGGLIYFARAAGFLPTYGGTHWTQLWPVLLIVIGLSLVRVRGATGVAAGIVLTIAVLGMTVLAMFRGQYQPMHGMMFDIEKNIRGEMPWFKDAPCNIVPEDSSGGWRVPLYR